MKRTVLFLALSLGLLAAPTAGRADFHPACNLATSPAASATVRLQFSSGQFTYTGHVFCAGATITIDLSISKTGVTLGSTSKTCGPPNSLCSTSGKVSPAGNGAYDVTMLFDVTHPTRPDFFDVQRRGRWHWRGAGQPVPSCVPHTVSNGQSGLCG